MNLLKKSIIELLNGNLNKPTYDEFKTAFIMTNQKFESRKKNLSSIRTDLSSFLLKFLDFCLVIEPLENQFLREEKNELKKEYGSIFLCYKRISKYGN